MTNPLVFYGQGDNSGARLKSSMHRKLILK